MGWIYTDGGIRRHKKSIESVDVTIYQSKEKTIEIIRNLLEELKVSFRECIRTKKTIAICGRKIKTQKRAHEFHIHVKDSRELLNRLQLIGKYDFPDWLWKLSDKQVNLLIDTMVLGDGAISHKSRVIWGGRLFLEKIQGLCVTHGIDCNLVVVKNRGYYLSLHHDSSGGNIRCIDREDRYIKNKREVTWCVTVPNHTVFTQLNGKPLISCNSNNHTNSHIQKLVLDYGGDKMNLVHNPEHADYRYKINLTGHIHNHWEIKRYRYGELFTDCINVGVDVWNFMPVNWGEINKRYSKWLKTQEIITKV